MSADTHEFFRTYLRRSGLRVTPERFEVLDAVRACKGHFDADELFIRLKNEGSKVSRATVYNTLEKLTTCGILSRYRFGERLARYELVYGEERHHHLICRTCGRIDEFVDERVDRFASDAAKKQAFQFEDAVMHIHGVCSTCSAGVKA